MIGQTISHYHIQDKLGQGGMGVVYKALDTRLDRTVALKFLPAHSLPTDEDKARFYREAKAAAKLNHSNIAHVYAIDETEDGQAFIAMEYVEGETLSERISRGPLNLSEAIQVTVHVAEGLQAAHERGIVHRDVKSSNIMLIPASARTGAAGQVKIMDFGLAKTAASTKLTQLGSTVGTIAYMSPEQARGEAVDHRSDIWSLGVVLYEMISGRLPFAGDYEQAVVYSIMNAEPEPLTGLRTGVPMALERVVGKLLKKDRSMRYQSAVEIPADLKAIDLKATGASRISTSTVTAPALHQPPSVERVVSWRVAALVGIIMALGAGLAGWVLKPSPPISDQSVKRYEILFPAETRLDAEAGPLSLDRVAVALSPNGRYLAFVASQDRTPRLFLRDLTTSTSIPLPGTEGAYYPFFSPDGNWIGFYAAGRLKKSAVTGGNPIDLCEVSLPDGADWSTDDTIVFTNNEANTLSVVSASGGIPENVHVRPADDPTRSSTYYGSVSFLPDERHVLVEGWPLGVVAAVDLDTGQQTTLDIKGYSPQYLPTGHLLLGREGGLAAVRFDPDRLETSGEPIQVVDDVYTRYRPQYAVSSNGSLVYAGGPWLDRTRFAWIDMNGTIEPLSLPASLYGTFQLSPEGDRVATIVSGPDRDNIWIFDLERGGLSRLTTDGNNGSPVWMPDGGSIIFRSDQGGAWKLLRETVGRVPQVDTLWVEDMWLAWISPDGRYLGGEGSYAGAPSDIYVGDLLEGGPLEPYIAEPRFEEVLSSLSPDGAYVAYTSTATGQFEIYVQPFPASGQQWPVSTDGGEEPIWSSTGERLYYRIGNRMMGVSVTYGADGPSFSIPQLIFEANFYNVGGYSYDLAADDERFLVLLPAAERVDVTHLNVVVNWFEELNRLVPTED